jgi:hypothetical protein
MSGSRRSPAKEVAMTKFREKAEARTKQIVGQMIGDEKLVHEGKEEERKADENPPSAAEDQEPVSQH